MSGKSARRKRQKQALYELVRYQVTQPPAHMQDQAAYPQQTTRIGSNSRYIHAANHPDWYAAAAGAEDGLLEALSKERLRQDYVEFLQSPDASSPIHAFGFAVMEGFRAYCRLHLANKPDMVRVFDNAVATVHSNLTRVIFADPLMLRGTLYPEATILSWEANFKAFEDSDVFTYRPPETGVDTDGERKPVIEMCPCPRLGRHLVRTGYELLLETVLACRVGAS